MTEYPCKLEKFEPNTLEECFWYDHDGNIVMNENFTQASKLDPIKCNGKTKYVSMGSIPTAAKFLRLGFHDCFKYQDNSGGCDGCLNFEGMFHNLNMDERVTNRRGKKRMANLPYDFLGTGKGAANNLAATADVLER